MRKILFKLFLFVLTAAAAVSCRPEVQGDGGSTPPEPTQATAPEPAAQPEPLPDTTRSAVTDDTTGIPGLSADSLGVARRDSQMRASTPVVREPSIMRMISGMEDTRLFADAIRRAGLENALDGPGPYTVFVPTDKALNNLPRHYRQILTSPNPSPAEKVRLINILHYHVLLQRQSAMLMNDKSQRPTAKGELLLFTVNPKATVVHGVREKNEARIIRGDLSCSNGLVHVVDDVLIPKDTESRNRKRDLLKR